MGKKNSTCAALADEARFLPLMEADECDAQIYTGVTESEFIDAINAAVTRAEVTIHGNLAVSEHTAREVTADTAQAIFSFKFFFGEFIQAFNR